jgi:hypothetical protein
MSEGVRSRPRGSFSLSREPVQKANPDQPLEFQLQGVPPICPGRTPGLISSRWRKAVAAFIRAFTVIVPTMRVADKETADFDTLEMETTEARGHFSLGQDRLALYRSTAFINSTAVRRGSNFGPSRVR